MAKDEQVKKPEFTIRAGNVSATVWENTYKKDGKEIPVKSISIVKNYTDDKEEWKQTSSFGMQELPKVALVATKAFERLSIKDEQD